MSSRLWYKRNGGDFVYSTMDLDLEPRCVFSLLLDLIYDSGGPISDDERWLSALCRVSLRKWRSLKTQLIERGHIHVSAGRIHNARAERELADRAEQARKHAENGAKGGRKRAENVVQIARKFAESDIERNENNELAQAGLKHRARVPESRYKNLPPIVPHGGTAAPPDEDAAVDVDFEKFWQVFPAGRKQDKLKALRMFRDIVSGRRGGVIASAGDLLAAAERYAAARAGQDPQFTKAPCNWLKDGAWFDDDPGSRRPPKLGEAGGAPTRDGPPDPAFVQQMRRVLGDAGYERFKARQRGEDVGHAADQPDHADRPGAQPMERADDADAMPAGGAAPCNGASAAVWSPPPFVNRPPMLSAWGDARLNDDALMNAWRQHGGENISLTITGG